MPHSDYILFHSYYSSAEACLIAEIGEFTGNEESEGLNFGVRIINLVNYHRCE